MTGRSAFTGLTLVAAALALAVPTDVAAQAYPATDKAKTMKMMDKKTDMAAMKMVHAKSLEWGPLEVPGFDPGAKMAVVSGDPSTTGPYTLRLDFPAGYKFPAHWHPNPENLTVLSGVLNLGMGDTWDSSKIMKYGAGDFLWVDGKNPHFGGADVPTVIQLHGMGPFAIELSKPMKK